jgi:16S rRNA (cytosine967-C5)-methyltransferase
MLRSLLDRVGGPAVVAVADAGHPPVPAGQWDLVLLDAPCSGSGVVRRHPELKWRLEEEALAELVVTQQRLLEGAWPLVADGGVLVYATCSLEPEENEQLLAEVPAGFESVELAGLMPDSASWLATPVGGVRLLPSLDCDGFTVHALRRR